MARRIALSSHKQISEINLTPLMDLTFILLITFIITFPLIEQGIPVNLPKGQAKDLSSEKARTVTVDGDGKIYLDDADVTLEQLEARMREVVAFDPDARVMVRADEGLKYGRIVKILKVLNDAKISKMALVTQGEESGGP